MKKIKIETDKGMKVLEYAKKFGDGLFLLYNMNAIKRNCRELKVDLRTINKIRYSLRNPITTITVMLPDECAQFIITPDYCASDYKDLLAKIPGKIKGSMSLAGKTLSLMIYLNAFRRG
jgi:hypothetical protein